MQYDSYRPYEKKYYDESICCQDEKSLQVPKQYTCNRCKQGGHHVLQCPTNEDPRFDVIPNATYVCMFCEMRGDHYRMFCPKNPVKNSIYKRRLAKGLIKDTESKTSNLSSLALRTSPTAGIKNANLIPLGANGNKRRFRSNSSSPVHYRGPVPARLLKEEDEDYISFERSSNPSPEAQTTSRSHKRIRLEDDPTMQHLPNQQEERKNELIAPIIDSSKSDILTQLLNGPDNIETNKRPTRLTALDMWEVNDIRKLREERYAVDQTVVPFQEDIDRYVQVKEAYEQGGQTWENALENLIEDAYRNLPEPGGVTTQAVRQSFLFGPSLPSASPLQALHWI